MAIHADWQLPVADVVGDAIENVRAFNMQTS